MCIRDRERAVLEAEAAELRGEAEALTARIPTDWEETFAAFRELEAAETSLLRDYRRAGDASAAAPLTLKAVLASTDALRALEGEIRDMAEQVRSATDLSALVDPVTELRSAAGDIEGGRDIRSAVNDARRALRGDEPDRETALAALDEALALQAAQIAWRERAERELLPGLESYVAEITQTVGARRLDRMPRSMALSIAACESSHRDLSLHF